MSTKSRRFWLLSLVSVLMLVFAVACGGQQPAAEPAPQEPAPVETAPEEPPAAEPAPTEEATTEEPAATEDEPAATDDEPAATDDETMAEEPPPAEVGNTPPVPNAEAASQFSGVTITYYGDSVGLGAQIDQALAAQFTEDTGIVINVVPKPESATENFATYQRFFQAQSSDIDVMMLDVIWPGAFAQHLFDLTELLGEEAQAHDPNIVENNTVDGRLVAMPWFTDFGMLYYRADLLEQYGFDGPPATWDELEEMAQTILEGEREAGNAQFQGFVWQGNSYEGLTCNALEWVYSFGGGTFISPEGEITVNDEATAQALQRAASWVGTISPAGVTSYQEEDARNVFQGGNAAFMRNWPYAFAAGNAADSPIAGLFGVAPLPNDGTNPSAGTVGGWQLAVSAYSQNPEAAVEFVRYMTSPEVLRYRALVGSYIPTHQEVQADPEIIEQLPFLELLANGDVTLVTRPSTITGELYNEASTAIFQGASQILQGQDPAQVLPTVEQRLQRTLQ